MGKESMWAPTAPNSSGPKPKPAGGPNVPWWRRLWRFIDRWMLHVLIGLPLAMAVSAGGDALNQYSDFYEVARTAPRYELSGVIEAKGRRWRSRRMFVQSGDETVMFFCSPALRYGCFDPWGKPFRGTVRLFDYRGEPIVLAVRREDGSYVGGGRSDGRYVATERDRLEDIKMEAERYGRDSFWKNQISTFLISLPFAIILALFLLCVRRSNMRPRPEGKPMSGNLEVRSRLSPDDGPM